VGLSDDLAHHYLTKEFLDPIANPHVIGLICSRGDRRVSALLPRRAGVLAAAAVASAGLKQRFDDDNIPDMRLPREPLGDAKGLLRFRRES
jgi:hypothetical protein